MHTGRNYSVTEVLMWTRRDVAALLLISTVPTACFVLLGWRWLAIPWLPVALLGTAVAFVVGFKNNASSDRLWEARRIWGAIVNVSRVFGAMVRDFVTNHKASPALKQEELTAIHLQVFERHFAWLCALRFALREKREWESIYKPHNAEYKNRWFTVEEHEKQLGPELKRYLSAEEFEAVMKTNNKAAQILALQSKHFAELHRRGLIEDLRHVELERQLVEMNTQQGGSERIKNFPYPRQYATLNLWFVKLFVLLIPLGMLQEFQKLGDSLVWLTIPFSALSGWIFTTLEKIGEASESPFEGSANDVPITSMARNIEIDMRQMIHNTDLPKPVDATHHIVT